ncbi:MAG TPA: EAL domain-containing protein [Nocardioides sp.]|nr:EAL domain-containing protein [Nocardioides sp.]
MGRETLARARSALRLLVVTTDSAGGAASAALHAADHELLVTRALTLPSALATLATDTFDCVLVDTAVPDLAAAEVTRAVRARAGTAMLVVAHAGRPTGRLRADLADLADLDELADLVLGPDDLDADWLRLVRMHARVTAAEASTARLAGIVDSVSDALLTVDLDGIVTSWNRAAEELWGYAPTEIVGRDVALLHPPGSAEPDRMLAVARGGVPLRDHDTVRRQRDGRLAEVTLDVAPTADGVVVVARDINGRRELEAELVRQTMHDALTGLPNRAYLTYRLAQTLEDARRRGTPVAVLVADLDQFRAVGDLHGHLVGDRVLVEVAERLRALTRPVDIVARSGGDEFVIVSPGTDVAAAAKLARTVIDVIGEPVDVEHRALRVGASVGIAVSPPLDGDAGTMLKHADVAMYEAKARGRSRSQVFDATFARQAGEQRRLAAELREALAQDLLDVHYQPVFDLVRDRIVGVEALARWQHPVGGAVSPATFVPLAEAHGFIAELDRWVLDRACLDIATALDTGDLPADVRVAVNLSARSLDDGALVATVADAIHRSGLPPEALVLEVTETAVLQNRDAARVSLEGLRALGAGVHLDDFGTGYSSLSFLRELPVTGVKIDRSFVRDAVDRPEDLAITEAIVRLARGLGLETVAEGIETVEQRDLLRRLGCVSAQGFWWSGAVPIYELPGAGLSRAAKRHEPRPVTAPRRWNVARRPLEPAGARTVCCLRGGLESGQGWIVVTSPSRRAEFARSLGSLRDAAVARGQLVELDAYETLRSVTGADGRLDTARFEQVVGTAMRRVGAATGDVGIHAELGHVNQPLLSLRVSTDLRRRLHAESDLTLDYGDHPADCAAHGAVSELESARYGDISAS